MRMETSLSLNRNNFPNWYFINQSGQYAANISTGGTGVPYVEHFCIDIKYTAEGTDFGDDADHTVTLSKCVCSLDFSEGDPSSFTLNFTCYGGASVTGPT
jgi:hypothetical protein